MIHIVTGHVCSGKTTYVRNNAVRGDVVIDIDRIALALSTEDTRHHEYEQHVADIAKAARWAAIDKAIRLHRDATFNVWIIHAYPDERDDATYRRIGATRHDLEVDADELRFRAKNERPERIQKLLEQRLEDERKSAVFSGKTHEKTRVFPAKNAVFCAGCRGVGSAGNLPSTP